jgi:outer membrane protein assembly factor BamA
MRGSYISYGCLAFLIIFNLKNPPGFSQIRQEKEEESPRTTKIMRNASLHRFNSSAGVFFGYDSNVRLSPESKGDIFEELLYSLRFMQRWKNNLHLSLEHDFNYRSYNEVTAASNILNHLNFGIHKKLPWINIGTGWSGGTFYYPENEEGDFFFSRPYLYLKSYLTEKLYYQLLFEYFYKRHTNRKALADTISTFQDKKRIDRRQGIEYSLGYALNSRLSLGFETRYSINNSNARYIDFYDYKTYEFSPRINYRLSKDLELISSVGYKKKDYKSRVVTLSSYKQKDEIYTVDIGIRYRLDKKSHLSLFYTHQNNSTSDSLEKYTENMFRCGWQYNF